MTAKIELELVLEGVNPRELAEIREELRRFRNVEVHEIFSKHQYSSLDTLLIEILGGVSSAAIGFIARTLYERAGGRLRSRRGNVGDISADGELTIEELEAAIGRILASVPASSASKSELED